MKRYLFLSIAALVLSAWACLASDHVFNVRDYGAAGDGVTVDSPAINAAIEAAALRGGGSVVLPAGVYLSYSIRLKDNIDLHLERGAVLRAAVATAEQHYDEAEPNESTYQDFGHSHWRNSLIWGIGLHDVSITGPGLIDGTGAIANGLSRPDGRANKAIALKECRNVTIRDISILNGGHFALLLTGLDNLVIDNVTADTNRDAFDIDCCSNVRVSNCLVNTLNDDAIVLKCSYALGYAKATENVTITNCHVSGYDPGSVLAGTFTRNITAAPDRDGPTGRIKFGTESNGGFRNIAISNCSFDHCRGLALETVDGAVIEDVTVDNIVMRDIMNSPIYVRLGARARGPEDLPASTVRRVKISNVTVSDADCRYASIIFGLEGHMIEDLTLSNIHIQYKGGLSMDDVSSQKGANRFFYRDLPSEPRDPYDVPQQVTGYPEPSSHGVLPSWGLFISPARRVVVDNVRLETVRPDTRPAIVLMDVEGVSFRDLSLGNASASPRLVLKDARDVELRHFDGLKDRVIGSATDTLIK